jgi:hypothetical protein
MLLWGDCTGDSRTTYKIQFCRKTRSHNCHHPRYKLNQPFGSYIEAVPVSTGLQEHKGINGWSRKRGIYSKQIETFQCNKKLAKLVPFLQDKHLITLRPTILRDW